MVFSHQDLLWAFGHPEYVEKGKGSLFPLLRTSDRRK